mmetsp:Transcript_47575/g.115903  ORF Transcript_47575/g.115903 Transcript_47575/m.115903 type:complete len:429 (+) Transcript_47575:174-1460(+)
MESMPTISVSVAAAATAVAIVVAVSLPYLVKIVDRIYHGIRLEVSLYRAKKNPNESIVGEVSGVFVYPVKSLRAVSLETSKLDSKGLVDDRRFMVVYELPLPEWKIQSGEGWTLGETSHRFLTQRQCPSLATITAKITYDEDKKTEVLVLSSDKKTMPKKTTKVSIPLSKESPMSNQVYRAGIWDDTVLVEDMGEGIADFLREIVDSDDECLISTTSWTSSSSIRLVRHCVPDRAVDTTYLPNLARTWWGASPLVSLTDGFPILLANERSLEDLNGRLKANNKDTIPMSRFRPNIVIGPLTKQDDKPQTKTSTDSQKLRPFDEDRWKTIAIGEQLFAIVKGCPRCKQSCTDQQTGTVYTEPVDTMKSFRRLGVSDGGTSSDDVFFAQNAVPIFRLGQRPTTTTTTQDSCKISVGDAVRVLDFGEPIFK